MARRFAGRDQNCRTYELLCTFTGPPSRQVGFRFGPGQCHSRLSCFMAFYYTRVPPAIATTNNPEPMTTDARCEKLGSLSRERILISVSYFLRRFHLRFTSISPSSWPRPQRMCNVRTLPLMAEFLPGVRKRALSELFMKVRLNNFLKRYVVSF